MPATSTPNQFGDPALTAAEAASACGPAAAVAFARANGRNPTLREAVDLAKRVGWTPDGGMNGVANQKRLLDQMGVPSELDTGANPESIRRRAQAGQNVTVSTPRHYYVVDGVDERGRVHVGQSGLARRGGSEWMTLEDIAARDGGINGALYQTVADTGGGQVASNAPAVSRTQKLFDDIVAAKGDPTSVRAVDPEVETETDETNFLGDPTGKKVKTKTANPAPTYRYTFADGTYLDARTPQGGGDLELRGGTAQTSAARPAAKPAGTVVGGQTPNEQFIVTVHPDGSVTQSPNPNYVAPAAAKPGGAVVNTQANEQYIVRQNPDGTISREPNPNYVAPKPGRSTHTVGGRAFTLDENGNVLSTVDLRSPQQTEKENIDLAAARQDLLPKQQQILQGHQDTIKYVQGMLERGEIDQPTADSYIALSKQAAESALKGYTPFQEMKEKREAEQANKRMGTDLLTQRLSSGAGLASSLLSGATSLAGHAMLRPGQTSLGVDPLAQLMPILEQLSGGADVAPFARSLLLGAQQPPPGPGGMPPLPAGL